MSHSFYCEKSDLINMLLQRRIKSTDISLQTTMCVLVRYFNLNQEWIIVQLLESLYNSLNSYITVLQLSVYANKLTNKPFLMLPRAREDLIRQIRTIIRIGLYHVENQQNFKKFWELKKEYCGRRLPNGFHTKS